MALRRGLRAGAVQLGERVKALRAAEEWGWTWGKEKGGWQFSARYRRWCGGEELKNTQDVWPG